jgi:hypothetical protein
MDDTSCLTCAVTAKQFWHLRAVRLLQVEGLGELQWPLTAAQAGQLKPLCQQAPHGRGEATVVDTSVRNTLQLSPDKFSIRQTYSWLNTLGKIVGDAVKELGVAGDVEAQLYKMLLYERGSFFVPHRDTEKVSDKIAGMASFLVGKPLTNSAFVCQNLTQHLLCRR